MKYDKLIKILMLTQSDNDGEALSAIRMANGMLKGAGHNWESFLKAIQTPPPAAAGDPSFSDIADIFSTVMYDIFAGRQKPAEAKVPPYAEKLSKEDIMTILSDLLQEYDGTATGMQVYKLKKAYATKGKFNSEEWQTFTYLFSEG